MTRDRAPAVTRATPSTAALPSGRPFAAPASTTATPRHSLAGLAIEPPAVIQRIEIPEHRLHPEIQPPTREEREEHERRWNFGDGGSGQEQMERAAMNLRGDYARSLDELSNLEHWNRTGERPVRYSELGQYEEEAKQYYVGPREAGHSIWIGFQENLRNHVREAFSRGYALHRPDVQQAVARASTARTLLESDGLGSAGRSNMRR